jgi:hypothetical protein
MRISIAIVVTVLLSSLTVMSSARAQKAGATPAAPSFILDARSYYGDKVVRFTLAEEGGKTVMTMASNAGDFSRRVLSSKDVEFLKAEFAKLPVPEKLPVECTRSHLTVTLIRGPKTAETKTSCLGVRTITSPAYARFARILVNSI